MSVFKLLVNLVYSGEKVQFGDVKQPLLACSACEIWTGGQPCQVVLYITEFFFSLCSSGPVLDFT